MIRHYFTLAGRGFLKNKVYTLINVFGLVFGMLSALIIAKYIGGSLQFDRHHEKKDRIYSIIQEEFKEGNLQRSGKGTYLGVGELASQYPEVVDLTQYNYSIGSLMIADIDPGKTISFFENRIFSVDPGFLNIFTFPLQYGDPETALSRANSVVISHSAAQRYFGDTNPIGKTLTRRNPWGQETLFNVTGVISDIPPRSQFNFDFLIAQGPLDPNELWFVPDCPTFLLLKEEANTAALSKTLTRQINELPQLLATRREVTLSMESLADLHLSSTEYLLIAVGIFIILISWVNYINQIIAQSHWRRKEIGMLRVMGATRENLTGQFAMEAGLVCVSSLSLVTIIYLSIEQPLQTFTNGHLLPLIEDPTPINFIFLLIFVFGAILAAFLPILILSSPHLGTSLQSNFPRKIGNVGLRQALVVLQFSISTILLISVFVISDQLDFMKGVDKGINMEDVLIVRAPIVRDTTWNVKRKSMELFKEKCSALPFVRQVASSTTVPGEEYRQETYLSIKGNTSKSMVHQNRVDDQFFDLYDVAFVAGQNFIPNADWKNRNSIILNESAARALGIVDPEKMINAKIVDHESNEEYDLVGIVKDYHKTSLKYKMRPIAFRFSTFHGHFSLRIDNAGSRGIEFEEKLNSMKQLWQQTYSDAAFDYYFLDAKYAAQDREDQYFGKLFHYFTLLSIVISCLGLFGLSLLISTKRQLEIGVRKVFGARSPDILAMFLKGYLKPLSVAVLVGSPLAYLLMNKWLENFAYRIEIGPGLIALAWLCLALIFLLTVSYHTLKSSAANPVSILRD